MARKKFTEEEIRLLKTSPYVLNTTPSIVHFSAEFKKLFWEAYTAGKKAREIVIELGLNPEILGVTRIEGLKSLIRNEVKAGKGFRDLNTFNDYWNTYIDSCTTPEARVRYLEHQLAYKDQEIEFLKKIVSLSKKVPE